MSHTTRRPQRPFWDQVRPLIFYVLLLFFVGCSANLGLEYLALIWWSKSLFFCIWIFFNGITKKKTFTFDCIVQDLKWCGKAIRDKNSKLSLWSTQSYNTVWLQRLSLSKQCQCALQFGSHVYSSPHPTSTTSWFHIIRRQENGPLQRITG